MSAPCSCTLLHDVVETAICWFSDRLYFQIIAAMVCPFLTYIDLYSLPLAVVRSGIFLLVQSYSTCTLPLLALCFLSFFFYALRRQLLSSLFSSLFCYTSFSSLYLLITSPNGIPRNCFASCSFLYHSTASRRFCWPRLSFFFVSLTSCVSLCIF